MKSCEDFIGLLTSTYDGIQAAYQEVLDEWRPEEPPMTTLFAAFGDRIAEDFGKTRAEENRRMFALIEQGMDSDDPQLVTAVATGLIEALVSRAAKRDGVWAELATLLGPRSRHHAMAWLGA